MSPAALGIQAHRATLAATRMPSFGYVSQGRVRRLSTLLTVFMAITLATMAGDFVDITVSLGAERTQPLAELEAEMMELRRMLARSLLAFSFVGCATVLGRFLVQANRNAAFLGAGLPTVAPSSMVLWFFVPLACLWRPYLAVRELWSMSTPRLGRDEGAARLLPLWWAAWLSAGLLGLLALQGADEADGPPHRRAAIVVELAAELALLLAAVLTRRWTRALSQRQDDARAEHVCDLAAVR
jgi:Domain of unknown function (DUF4328)